jgi:predicted RNase H-like HicB family nuclease
MRYAVIIETTASGYSAYVPDLPGCVAAGSELHDVERLIGEAVAFHLDGLRADGLPLPLPRSRVDYVDVAA